MTSRACAMAPFPPRELRQFADVLQLRTGVPMTVRFVEPGDVDCLRRYFEALSPQAHYNRFLGATRSVPQSEFARMLLTGYSSAVWEYSRRAKAAALTQKTNAGTLDIAG